MEAPSEGKLSASLQSPQPRRRISKVLPRSKPTSGIKPRRISSNDANKQVPTNKQPTPQQQQEHKDDSGARPKAKNKASDLIFRPLRQVRSSDNVAEMSKMPTTEQPSKMPMSTVTVRKSDPTEMLMEMCGKSLVNYSWYHGLMPRTECECLLKEDGDFIVRRTTLKKSSLYCLSVMATDPKHFPLNYKDGSWTLCGIACGSLPELINTLQREKCILAASKAVLKNPIPRPDYYLLHENIVVDKKLGAGAFGEVYTGIFKQKEGELQPVAIKLIKGDMAKPKLAEFVGEAKLMRRFQHQNCVRILGVAPQDKPLMIVLELCVNGSLKSWCKKNDKPPPERQQINFLKDAARGMCYLSQCKVIHRDLAARNCLLDKDLVLKISDFGLSVAGCKELVLQKLTSVPVRWLAPETLSKGVFNEKTDVWSFGVLTWEIFSNCKTDPFPAAKTNAEAKAIILGEGAPMTAPAESPAIVQKVLDACFEKNPTKRADFVQMLKLIAPEEAPPESVKNSG